MKTSGAVDVARAFRDMHSKPVGGMCIDSKNTLLMNNFCEVKGLNMSDDADLISEEFYDIPDDNDLTPKLYDIVNDIDELYDMTLDKLDSITDLKTLIKIER